MKSKGIIFIVAFIIIVAAAIGSEKLRTSHSESSGSESAVAQDQPNTALPQLEGKDREQSATMGLIGAPPMQPADHIDRWNPEIHHESCMTCHAVPSTGAPTPPVNHYYDENINGKIFRDNCQQCHATQNDSKAAFNDGE